MLFAVVLGDEVADWCSVEPAAGVAAGFVSGKAAVGVVAVETVDILAGAAAAIMQLVL